MRMRWARARASVFSCLSFRLGQPYLGHISTERGHIEVGQGSGSISRQAVKKMLPAPSLPRNGGCGKGRWMMLSNQRPCTMRDPYSPQPPVGVGWALPKPLVARRRATWGYSSQRRWRCRRFDQFPGARVCNPCGFQSSRPAFRIWGRDPATAGLAPRIANPCSGNWPYCKVTPAVSQLSPAMDPPSEKEE